MEYKIAFILYSQYILAIAEFWLDILDIILYWGFHEKGIRSNMCPQR